MLRVVRLGLVVFVGLSAGCAARPRPPAPVLKVEPAAVARATNAPAPPGRLEEVPIGIRKLVASQKTELADMNALAQVVGDHTGRLRAQRDVDTLATEFTQIESGLVSTDSAQLDDTVAKLLRLDSKIEILHDKLRAANPDPGAPKVPD
jgi:hypothetical protein